MKQTPALYLLNSSKGRRSWRVRNALFPAHPKRMPITPGTNLAYTFTRDETDRKLGSRVSDRSGLRPPIDNRVKVEAGRQLSEKSAFIFVSKIGRAHV